MDRFSLVRTIRQKLHSTKAWIFLGLTLIAYGLMFFRLFGQFLVLESMIYVMLFFVFFHFLYLEIRKLPIKYLFLSMLVLTALQGLYIGYTNTLLVLAMLAINVGIVYFAWFLQSESRDKVTFSSQGYFNVGGYIFTVFITIGYSLFVLGYYAKFPFTCQDLSAASNSVIDFVVNPLKLGIGEVKNIKSTTELFFDSKLQDLKLINIKSQTQEATFLSKLNEYKKGLIDQAFKDNTMVNMGICDYVLGQINTIYASPGFQTSVIVLMFLLLYGFVRIVFWVMTGIAFVIFKILFALKVYHIKIVLKEVEDLE